MSSHPFIATPSGKQGELMLPLARVRRLIKTEEDVKMVSSEASFLITKSTELFLELLSQRAAAIMDSEDRTQLTYNDVATSVDENDPLEFLRDIVPMKVSGAEVLSSMKRPGDE
ncbi:hypothetical protein CYMTET_4337 [Cymbomonas tetramitiformis]|uniref:Transcription factor CBF/NF-Y/archaeal histone domain-containing protein n=1 Tax=Cymbomonas tetramitiformis TaxID=36881 RepID=A0AAE0H1M6_9CHLO|nr:hypothetical protein CYMTET_4337 [Cymbomonas tetramitiformis]